MEVSKAVKLTQAKIRNIRQLLSDGFSCARVAKAFGVSHSTIRRLELDGFYRDKGETDENYSPIQLNDNGVELLPETVKGIKYLLSKGVIPKWVAHNLNIGYSTVFAIHTNRYYSDINLDGADIVRFAKKFNESTIKAMILAQKERRSNIVKGYVGFGASHNMAKLSESDVLNIKKMIHEGHIIAEIAKKYHVGVPTIRDIEYGKTWSHVAFLSVSPPVKRPKFSHKGTSNTIVKLNAVLVKEIRAKFATGEKTTALAKVYGISDSAMRKVASGRTWKNI